MVFRVAELRDHVVNSVDAGLSLNALECIIERPQTRFLLFEVHLSLHHLPNRLPNRTTR